MVTDRGCFGMPSTFSHESSTCDSCTAKTECSTKVLAVLHLIRHNVKVDHLIARFETGESTRQLTLGQRTKVASMPSKVGPRLEAMFLTGFADRAHSLFANRINPFSTSVKHMKLAGELLLREGFTKKSMRQQFQQEFGWTEATAFVEVARTIALLRGLDLITEVGGSFALADTAT